MVRDRQTSIKSFLARNDGSQGDPIQLDGSPPRNRSVRRPQPSNGSSPLTTSAHKRRRSGNKRDRSPDEDTGGEGLDDIHLEPTKTQLEVDETDTTATPMTLEQRRRAGRILDSSDDENGESSSTSSEGDNDNDNASSRSASVLDLISEPEEEAPTLTPKNVDKVEQKSLARNALIEARERRRNRQEEDKREGSGSELSASSDPLNLGASSRRQTRQSLQEEERSNAEAGPGPSTRITRSKVQQPAAALSPDIDWSRSPITKSTPAKRNRRAQSSPDHEASSEPESEVDATVRRRSAGRSRDTPNKRKKRVRDPDDPSSEEEHVNPDELLREIEMDEPVITESRLRTRDKKTDFQRNLELLRRKKLQKSGRQAAIGDDERSESSLEVVDVDSASTISSASSVNSDNFIVDEDGDEDNPGHLLPAAFRMTSHQDLEYSFKLISQYFTHLVVDGPGFASEKNSTYFRPAFHALARKIQSQKDSSVTSSVWPNEFKHSLEKYPELVISYLDEALPGCDACRISGRMSKYEGSLRGEPYDPETFETVENSESESDEDEQSDRGPFKLGKYCRARAEVFSGFAHWEYELYTAYYNSYHSLLREMNLEADSSDDNEEEPPVINLESDEDEMWVQPIQQKKGPKKKKKKPPGPVRKVYGFTEAKVGDADEVLENYFEKKGLVKERWRALESLIERAQQLEVNAASATRYDD